MRLVPISDQRPGQKLTCISCGRMRPVEEMQADLDGPAFQSYWCNYCIADLRHEKLDAALENAKRTLGPRYLP